MARVWKSADSNADGFSKLPARRSRGWFRKRYLLLFALVAMLAGVAVGLPMGLSNKDLVVNLANRFSGLAPIRVDIASISVGWLSPLKVEGLRLIDQNGDDLIKLGVLDTELSLWKMATDRSDIGTITLNNAEMLVDVQPGTTSLEEALKPLLGDLNATNSTSNEPASSASSVAIPKGRIRIANALLTARDSIDLSVWQLVVNEADIPLPTAEQRIPPITLVGAIQQVAGNATGTNAGQFTIRTEPIAGVTVDPLSAIPPMKMAIATTALPLEWYSLLNRRLTSLPIDAITGQATVQADVTMMTPSSIAAKITTAQIDNLTITSPQIVGNRGASLSRIRLSGDVSMSGDRLLAENAILESDIGALGVAASMPMNFQPPTATKPWIQEAQWNIQGNVDLARLVRVAPDMIPMQDGTKLVSGKATLSSIQTLRNDRTPSGEHKIELGDLVATVAGTSVSWPDAFSASANIQPDSSGNAAIKANCKSEFCDINTQGDFTEGSLVVKVDLDKLHSRVSQWFVIPMVQQMSGTADVDLKWNQESATRLIASGQFETTPTNVILTSGRLNEPAWAGTFEAIGTKDRGSLIQVDRASLVMTSQAEKLKAELLEPVSVVSPAAGAVKLPPGALTLELTGNLALIQRRLEMLTGINPGMAIDGQCSLVAQGAVDMVHAEVTSANFKAKSFSVNGDGYRVREPVIEGTFAGRVDTSDIARLQVDNLQVQASSFALTARDSATADGRGRQGKAAFRIDPSRMMSSIESATSASVAPLNSTVSSAASVTTAIEADLTGSADWIIDPASDIRWQTTLDGKDIRVKQTAPASSQPAASAQLVSTPVNNTAAIGEVDPSGMSLLWEEPLAKANCVGKYDIKTGQIELSETTVQTTWMAYGGKANVESTADAMKLIANGQMTYDAATVAEKLRPWTGNYLVIQGQRTEPVEFTWTSNSKVGSNWADALQARTQIGWDSANVVGIAIGKSDVPLVIENGIFKSKTSIPVSQGAMRWDLTGNVGGDPIVIRQAPEMVLENVAITPQMCQGWLKYVAPLLADATSVQGQISLQIDNAEIVPTDSLRQTIAGQLQIQGASIGPGPLADQLLGIVQQVRALRKGITTDPNASPGSADTWLQMPPQNINFAVDKGRVSHKNLQIKAGDIVMTTEGSVSVDGQLSLTATIPIAKEWVDGTPALASLVGQSIQIPVGGTIQKPQVDVSAFASVTRQLGEAAVQGALRNQLDKGLNKILGPIEKQMAPIQQGIQKNLPNLPNLGGFGIPGFGS
jgi:translocation and assembly module TamB